MNTSQYTLCEQIAKCSKEIKPHRYVSQPMSKKYSTTFLMAYDHAVPSQIQEAFRRVIA